MSKLTVDQKKIKDLFSDSKADFLIPDYQRPYAWSETECRTLWDDIFDFAFPERDYTKFKKGDEYFLGPIVTFKNEENGKQEVIDGQQRLTTLMLLLRAFYAKFTHMLDENSVATKRNIEKCIWKTDEFDHPDMDQLKIDSEVVTDKDRDEFLSILKNGVAEEGKKSRYAVNFRFFQSQIDDLLSKYPSYFAYLPTRILNNCILLPIEADSKDTALRIFSTLNDRGKPLADADIFKAQLYKFYSLKGKKDEFITRWKGLEEMCGKAFRNVKGSTMDEIFTRFMYFARARQGIKASTTEALRKFFERDGYALFHDDATMTDMERLARFWVDIAEQDRERFSTSILKRLFVLNYAPNGMWTYYLSVYFLAKADKDDKLDEADLIKVLDYLTAFVWRYALTNPGVNALRTPVYAEMVKLVNGEESDFTDYKIDENTFRSIFDNYNFYNQRPLTKSMITWWAFQHPGQQLPALSINFETEHIYARNRYEKENPKTISSPELIECLGNKSILEKTINISASDYRFEDKKKYYVGYTNSRGEKKGTIVAELQDMAFSHNDFVEADLLSRDSAIKEAFISFLRSNDQLI